MGRAAYKKLLVVEDCQSDVFLLERMLDDAGASECLDIVSTPRLTDAFRLIDKNRFDAILLDLNLLDMDGVASVAALSAQAPGTPIIVYSGTESSKVQEAAMLCGARYYLVKGRQDGRSLQHIIETVVASARSFDPTLTCREE